ncbi:MAG: excinuclease ABC subunit UvrC [Syntrophomonadaceae bacterium]
MRDRLKNVPMQPGVYIYKDSEGRVIYVGKAKLLRNRMRSYFQASEKLEPKVRAMMNRVAGFDFIVTGSEMEALLLEDNLIKAHHPRYNILLRDDKTYPYLKLTVADEFPRLSMVREKKDGVSRYFGPYTDAASLRENLRVLNSIFMLRSCKTFSRRGRPCLNHDIGRCWGPCVGKVSPEDYQELVRDLIAFMEGDYMQLVKSSEMQMKEAAANLEYEKAARLRDQVQSLKRLGEKQQVALATPYNLDLAALVLAPRSALALIFKIRRGKLISKESFWLTRVMEESEAEMMEFLLRSYFTEDHDTIEELLVNHLPANRQLLSEWFKELSGHRVDIRIPVKGEKRRLMEMVENNARLLMEEQLNQDDKRQRVLLQLSQALNLETIPERIECYDVSHLGGTETVASMVVFTHAAPDKKAYRRFKIKQEQNDDYSSLAETLQRRFKEARQGNPNFLPEPDLLVIDGGLGQLHAAQKVLHELGEDVAVISLAKKREEIFLPGQGESLLLPRRDEGLQLLQRLRDEAHRFAISYNRQRRNKKITSSLLDEIPGVGEKRKKALLQHFGSVNKIRAASPKEISSLPGISINLARDILNYLLRQQKS